MILTCPECATSYFVADGRIPPEGRRVKCTSCGARWMAQGDDDPLAALMDEAEPGPTAPAASAPPEAEPAPDPLDDLIVSGPEAEPEVAAEPEPSAEDTGLRKRPPAARRPAPPPPKRRSGALLWGGVAAMIAALVAATVVFREDVVRVVPQTAGAFEGVGLGVPGGGLVIEGVKAAPTFVSGRPALEITGAIRNLRGSSATPPPLRVSLVNRAGKPLAAKTARAQGDTIPAHERRYFALAIVDPPADSHDLEVTFLPQEGAAHAVPSHASEAAAAPEHRPADSGAGEHAEPSSDHG